MLFLCALFLIETCEAECLKHEPRYLCLPILLRQPLEPCSRAWTASSSRWAFE
jgi:hypothetical protein